jgi:hypothetical protein
MTNERKGPASGRVAERRTHPRYGIAADAEVIEDASGTRIVKRREKIEKRRLEIQAELTRLAEQSKAYVQQ